MPPKKDNTDRIQLLSNERIPKLLLHYGVPAVVGTMVNALYSVVDRIFIGQGVSEFAITGLALTFPILLFIQAFGMLIGVGASSRVSIHLGEGKHDEAENILSNALLLTIVTQVLVLVPAMIWLEEILRALGANDRTLPFAYDYADNDPDASPTGEAGSHGTHVAGITAGNAGEIAGIAPDAQIIVAKVARSSNGGIPPYAETQNYVSKILALMVKYQAAQDVAAVGGSLGDALEWAKSIAMDDTNHYVLGSQGPTAWDCSGLTGAFMARLGVALPRTAREQSTAPGGVDVPYDQMQPGDLIFWDWGDGSWHTAIALGGGQMVSADSPESGINIEPVFPGVRNVRRFL